MFRELSTTSEAWPLAAPFRISRGVKVVADVVVVEIRQSTAHGRGEGVPSPRYGESVDSVLAQIRSVAAAIGQGMTRDALQDALPPGAARNALDCALWDLSASVSGLSVATQLAHGATPALLSAWTISLDAPEAMHAAAVRARASPLLKVKLDSNDPATRLRAVRDGAPEARLIVDANEGWTLKILESMQPTLVETRVELVEQPLPAREDEALRGFQPAVPLCADESCHVAADVPKLADRYQAVNIKLDKTGGLTEALVLLEQARLAGMQVMCGCMICTSLSIAPAFHIARHADFVDLDGPLWLKQDRPSGVRTEGGKLLPPTGAVWGGRS